MTTVEMTKDKWLQIVQANRAALRTLVANYHPAAPDAQPDTDVLPITAPNAEAACSRVRAMIQKKEAELGTPAARFDKALAAGNIIELYGLLSSAWFGIPESTGCWNIPGFGVLCRLLDDPPRMEEMPC